MDTSNPYVSVIIPTYNRARILEDSIESVINQTYGNFELLIVDDASTDNTRQTVTDIDDDRITYFRHDENKGAPAARNTGLAAADGDIIAFQDSDDEWAPTKLEKQIQAFQRATDEVGVVYTGMTRSVQGEDRYIPYDGVEQKEGQISHSLARQNFVPTQVAAVRAECFDAVGGFDEDAWPVSDWELWIRISQQYEFELVDEPLVSGEVREDSISTNQAVKVRAREHIVNKHREYFDDESLSHQLFYVGHGYMKLGDTVKGRRYLKQAARTARKPVCVAALALSYLGPSVYSRLYQRYKSASVGNGIARRATRRT